MSDFTLAVVGGIVLSEGIKFLYSQAGEALKRWHECRKAAPHGDTVQIDATLPESLFEGHLEPLALHFSVFDRRIEEHLRSLRADITDYAEGWREVDPNDQTLLNMTDELRKVMELIYQQRITFKGEGEKRPASGPVVKGELTVDNVLGEAQVLRLRKVGDGHFEGKAKAGIVGEGGKFTVIDLDNT